MADTPEATTTTIDASLDGTQTDAGYETDPAAAQDTTYSQDALDAAVERARREAREEAERTKQAEIDAAVQKRLARAKRQKPEPSTKEEPDSSSTPDAKRSKAEILQSRDAERLFDRSYAKHGDHLTDRQLKVVEAAFMAEPPDPEDVTAWWKDQLKDFGWSKPETSPAQRTDTAGGNGEARTEPVKKSNPNAVDNTAVAGHVSWKQITDPTELTAEHIQQIRTEKGVRGGNRFIREMWETWGKTTRVLPPTSSK